MEQQIYNLARLAQIDVRIDELHEDLGDLPLIVKRRKKRLQEVATDVEAMKGDLSAIELSRKQFRVDIQETHDREKRLSEQQFAVKNNREFDAITSEINHQKSRRDEIEHELATLGIKEENIKLHLVGAEQAYGEAKELFEDAEKELDSVSGDQNSEIKSLAGRRQEYIKELSKENYSEYERIRGLRSDAAVAMRKGSCSGCFCAVPPQKQLEMRNHLERLFMCEHCGRFLIPDEITVPDLDE